MRISRLLAALIAASLFTAIPVPSPAQFSVGVGATIGAPPPLLPLYAQPPAPAPNYQWNPGYWGWGTVGYYWVPGSWVPAPRRGLYWTPGYWRHTGARYEWSQGFWGPSVGFYGGVNYGFGYFGTGFVGGIWAGNNFRYNTAVVNVNRTVIHNTYVDTTVDKNVYSSRVSYNGGHGGISAKPSSGEMAAAQHPVPPTAYQKQQATNAGHDRNLYESVNKGSPPVSNTQKKRAQQQPPA
ncbi:MAG: hypothetical protein WA814_02100 [Candidatus Baltobacteraceae bacterium]